MIKGVKTGDKFTVVQGLFMADHRAEVGDRLEVINKGKWTLHVRVTAYYKSPANGRKCVDERFEDIVDRHDFLDFVEKVR